jgi:Ca2+-binding RTX toxin-like protein
MALIKGSRVGDRLVGTAGFDFIYAFKGNDTILAGVGNDQVFAGDGHDRIEGGAGDDTLFGDGWFDFSVNIGDDTIFAGDGNDQAYGDAGRDSVDGGRGDDYLSGNEGADTLAGGDGHDEIDGRERTMAGQTTVLREIDRIFGGGGNDEITLDQKDVAYGGTGDDVLLIDTFAIPPSVLRLDFSNIEDGVATSFVQAGSYWGTTKAGQFESVRLSVNSALSGSSFIGSSGDDSVSFGLAFNNTGTTGVSMDGRGGNDYMSGSEEEDRMVGGAGNDSLRGFSGNDTQFGNSGDDELFGEGGDRLTGGSGNDRFVFYMQPLPGEGTPTVLDFNRADDILVFYPLMGEVNFGNEGNLLRQGATVTNGTTAAGIGQFLYDTDSGHLSIVVAILEGAPTLTVSDIWFV